MVLRGDGVQSLIQLAEVGCVGVHCWGVVYTCQGDNGTEGGLGVEV